MNRILGNFMLFTICLYLSFIYANNKFGSKKEEIIVKEVPLPTTYKDYFNQTNLIIKYSDIFGHDATELNLINSGNVFDEKKENKVFVPQRFFVR